MQMYLLYYYTLYCKGHIVAAYIHKINSKESVHDQENGV